MTDHFQALKIKVRSLPLPTIIPALSAPLVAALVFAIGCSSLVYKPHQERLDQLTQQWADQQAAAVTDYLDHLQTRLQRLSSSNSLNNMINNDNTTIQQAGEAQLRSALPQLLAYRPIPIGTAKRDANHSIPIRFIELDMITRAEQGESVSPEAVKLKEQWILQLVTAIKHSDDSEPRGTLLISLSQQALADQLEGQGQSKILQRYGKETPKVIAQHGSSLVTLKASSPTSNPLWQVQFTPSQAQVDANAITMDSWISVAALTLFSLLATFFTLRFALQRWAAYQASQVQELPAREFMKKTSSDILDIELLADDNNFGSSQVQGGSSLHVEEVSAENFVDIPSNIFRAYDIRGIAEKELNRDIVTAIGKAIGSEALDNGQALIAVARDGRKTSPLYSQELIKGIISTGCNVVNIGSVPSPVLYFATHHLDGLNSGVMITASHNPPEYNGFKIVINGKTLADAEIMALKQRIDHQQLHQGHGQVTEQSVSEAYIERICGDIILDELKVVIDAGNGIAGEIGVRLFEALDCEVIPLHCMVDANFPNHPADPSIEANLKDLQAKVLEEQADLGIAFDGDGDRLGVVTKSGRILWADELLILFARDVVARNPGADVIFDVKCSSHLSETISSYGGRPLMWKSGHSHIKNKMHESGALLAGEFSGHIFFKERWYGFDDALYAAARLMEIMTVRDQDLDAIAAAIPATESTPMIDIPVDDSEKFALMDKICHDAKFSEGKINTIDGLRVDFRNGWGLVRASNTSANITLRFEAKDSESLRGVQETFRRELNRIAPSLDLPF